MNYVYPAMIYPETDGRYSVVFPDFGGLATFGDTLPEALSMAQEACGQRLFSMLQDGEKLPVPSEPQALHPEEETGFVNLILVDLDAFAKKYYGKAVKKTLSIPAWLNTACEAMNINYSKVLQEALIAKLQA